MLIGLVTTAGSIFFILEKTQKVVLAQRGSEAQQFFESTVREADRRFQQGGHQFVALLEQGRVLEAGPAQLEQARFVAFATAFGGTLDFTSARILDAAGRTMFGYKAERMQGLEVKHQPDGELGWVFDKAHGILYRTFSSSVHFGSQVAAIELYAPVDERVLGAMAYPNTALDLHWKGIPVASAKFQETAEPVFFSGMLVKQTAAQWGEGGILHVKQGIIIPMSIGWRLAFVILCYIYVCLALWWVLGRWLHQQFVRFSSIAEIADGYRAERGLSAGDLEKLRAQGIGEQDELGQLAGSLVAMVHRIENARLAQQESARGLKLAWQQRTEAEQRLESSARRFEAVASASRAIAWEFDVDLNLVYVSDGVESLLGYTPEERLQERSIAAGTGPGAAMHVRLSDALRRCLREGIPFRGIEVELHHRDGRIVHVLCAGTPALAENGAIRGVVGTSTDIGEVKRARDRVDTLLESTGAVLYACRPEGDYGATYVSANVLDVMGYEAREFTDDPGFWFGRVHPEDVPKLIEGVSSLREIGTLKHEYRFLHADGTYRWMYDDLRLVRDSNGASEAIVGFWLDITQRKEHEARQRESHKLEAIGRLTGGVAHEFNNLLGVIVGNLDLIGEKSPGERHQIAALEAALKGAEITRSLLAVAQHQSLSLETHDLDLLLEEMLPVLVTSLEPDVRLRSSLWGGGELLVHLDSGGLGDLVMALVENAREAMRMMPGRHLMVLRTRMETVPVGNTLGVAPGGYAVLEVVDTGIGMTESVREKAFEPFFTTKDRVKGGGLGLAMVYGYAEQLGGTARIESARDAGTRVSVYLPLDPSHAHRPPRTETELEKAKADA